MDNQAGEHPSGDLQPVLVPLPLLSQQELIRLQRSMAKEERNRLTIESQGSLIANMAQLITKLGTEVTQLKRVHPRQPEESTPAKRVCTDPAEIARRWPEKP